MTEAAKLLFALLTDHRYESLTPYEDMWSTNSNEFVLERLHALCKHFDIDAEKIAAFLKTQTPCDYCGERGDAQEVGAEHVCSDCLHSTE